MKPEQRATRDEHHDLKMPRQGVSFLNDMLGGMAFMLGFLAFGLPLLLILVLGSMAQRKQQEHTKYNERSESQTSQVARTKNSYCGEADQPNHENSSRVS